MPEISELMAVWPTSFEETINNMQLSLSELDCSLKDYVDIICGMCNKIMNHDLILYILCEISLICC